MQNYKILNYFSVYSYRRLFFNCKRCYYANSESIVVVSAVRTPWGKYQGQLSTVAASHLGSIAVEAAVKQSAVALEQFKQIYMAQSVIKAGENTLNEVFSSFLKKANYTPITSEENCDVKTILMGLQALKSKQNEVIVVGGMESATQIHSTATKSIDETKNYFSSSLKRYLKAQEIGCFDEEIVPVTILQQSGKRKLPREITQDEVYTENSMEITKSFDGASALVLTTYANAKESNITPLAIIKDFEYSTNTSDNLLSCRKNIDKLLLKSKLQPKQIHHWEIDHFSSTQNCSLLKELELNSDLVNPHGDSVIFGQTLSTSLPSMLTHVCHSLTSSQYGCVVSNNATESLAIMIQKFPNASSSGSLPRLTLYTKNPCSLCDMLVEELEVNFAGEYELENVFIDTKENVRFLRLYRHDIPVVFLNGQFLCMHRLNNRLLRRKLDLLKLQ